MNCPIKPGDLMLEFKALIHLVTDVRYDHYSKSFRLRVLTKNLFTNSKFVSSRWFLYGFTLEQHIKVLRLKDDDLIIL